MGVVAAHSSLFISCACAAEAEQQPSPDVRAILREDRPRIERINLLGRLARTDYPDRAVDLQRVLEQHDETLSYEAAVALVRLNVHETAGAMAESALTWTDAARNGLLARVYFHPTGPASFGVVARRTLERIAAEPAFPTTERKARASSADYGALTLTQLQAPGDVALIQSVLLKRAESWGVWLARGFLRPAMPLTPEEIALGTAVVADPATPERVRVAVSVALFGAEVDATRRVTEGIDAGLAEFGAVDAQALAEASIVRRDPRAKEQSKGLAAFLVLVSDLEFLSDGAFARTAIERCRAAENLAIAETAAYVAARRFPEMLITGGRGRVEEVYFNGLLDLVARTRPEMRAIIEPLHPSGPRASPAASPDDQGWQGAFGKSARLFMQ